MKKNTQILFLLLILLTGCKVNQDAYNTAYRKMKDKEEAMMDANAKIAMDVPKKALSGDSIPDFASEPLHLILGDAANFMEYNIVARSFINRTNARGYYSQLSEKGYPTVLVQNEEMMFRIIVASFQSKEEAKNKLTDFKKSFPEAYILVKLQ